MRLSEAGKRGWGPELVHDYQTSLAPTLFLYLGTPQLGTLAVLGILKLQETHRNQS